MNDPRTKQELLEYELDVGMYNVAGTLRDALASKPIGHIIPMLQSLKASNALITECLETAEAIAVREAVALQNTQAANSHWSNAHVH